MQVKVVDQVTNKNVLNTQSGIKGNVITQVDLQRQSDDQYYIELTSSDFSSFSPFTYYKVQMRSCPKNASSDPPIREIYDNSAIYSEWSTVCLIRGILEPKLVIKYFQSEDNDYTHQGVMFTTDVITVSGTLIFPSETDKYKEEENIKYYQVKFYNSSNELIEDSGILFPQLSNLRAIDYIANTCFSSEAQYKLKIFVTTTSLYEYEDSFLFSVAEPKDPSILVEVGYTGDIHIDEENGRVKIYITGSWPEIEQGQPPHLTYAPTIIYIRRTDSYSSFQKWEDIHSFEVAEGLSPGWAFEWYDQTIESGVWYKYSLQFVDQNTGLRFSNQILSIDATENKFIISTFDNSFLTGQNGQQLKVTYDLAIDNLSYFQNIQKIDTIGSKYPFIRQNSAGHYRTLDIKGLITFLSDEDNVFIDDNELFINNTIKELYDVYNAGQNITDYNNYIKEREFREAVMDFLLKDDVKLFRSTTEGNILVKLLDVKFSPKQELGRYIYDFSATLIECGECSIQNYAKYKIQARSNISYNLIEKSIGPKYNTRTDIIENPMTAIKNIISFTENNNSIRQLLLDSYEPKVIDEDFTLDDFSFSEIYIEFISNPLLITSDKQLGHYGQTNVNLQSGWIIEIIDEDDNSERVMILNSNPVFHRSFNAPVLLKDLKILLDANNPQAQANVIISGNAIYSKQVIIDADGNIVNPEETPIVNAKVEYNYIDCIQINYQDFSWDFSTNLFSEITIDKILDTDIIIIAKNKNKQKYIHSSGQQVTFEPYRVIFEGYPRGTYIQVTYQDNSIQRYIVGQTGQIDINVDTDTSDNLMEIKEVKIYGQIISWDKNLSGVYDFNNEEHLIQDQGTWQWEQDGQRYEIEFFNDLAMLGHYNGITIQELNPPYGVIKNYFALPQDTTTSDVGIIRIYAKVGREIPIEGGVNP